jgi:hypothetical protein
MYQIQNRQWSMVYKQYVSCPLTPISQKFRGVITYPLFLIYCIYFIPCFVLLDKEP